MVIEIVNEQVLEMVNELTLIDTNKNRTESEPRMPYKRPATDDEITALAERLRPLWRSGDAVRPWLRKHGDLLINFVHDD
jgi:hypothetical protein